MPYRSLDTTVRWLRVALVCCAGAYFKDATRLLDMLPEYAAMERTWSIPRDARFGSSDHDPLQDIETVIVVAVIVLLVLFFERAYRNLRPLGLSGALLWRSGGRAWRALTACWCALLVVAGTSVAAGNQLHAGMRTIDESQFRDPIEAAGELVTASTALLTAVLVTVIWFRQARRASELGLAA